MACSARQQVFGDLEVLVERHGRAVPHVRLEDRVASGLDLGLAGLDERQDEAVERILRAVVGVQRDGDRVVLRDLGGEFGERERAGCAVLDGLAGEVVGAAGRDLDDAVDCRPRSVPGARR